MLFSLVVPTFNSKAFIRRCLDSILVQSFKDFEIVVIDDGSTDGTSEILDEYATKSNLISVYHFANAGVSAARRRGITLSNGEYIIFVDSDDTVNPDLLQKLADAIFNYGYPDILRIQANLINDTPGKDSGRYNFKSCVEVPLSGIEAMKMWSVPNKKYAVYWLFAFKASIFSKVLFVTSLRCYEDLALIPVLVSAAEKVVVLDYVGYNYTCNNVSSLTNTCSLEAEINRANDFYEAFLYAIENFSKLDNVTSSDLAFFIADFNRRLRGKFDSLPEELKPRFEHWFK